MSARGVSAWGVCIGGGRCLSRGMYTEAGGTHPTEMHSCVVPSLFLLILCFKLKLNREANFLLYFFCSNTILADLLE